MSFLEVERIIKRIGPKEINNSTQVGTFVVVDADKFTTKGISNRDNARWKRAQYIIIEHCPSAHIQLCLKGFLQFSEYSQFLIIANTNQVFRGNGTQINLSQIISNQ